MELLQPKQSVTLILDDVEASFECFVRSVSGAITTLGQLGGVAPSLQERLTPGSLGYMTWRSIDGGRTALRGVATTRPDTGPGLAFVVIEALDLLERRGAPRIPLVTVVRLRPLHSDEDAGDGALETLTVDLSVGGALLEGVGDLGVGAWLLVELCFEGLPSPVECEARVVREAGGHLGIKFTKMDERHRARLAIMLAHHRRRLEAA